MDIQQYLHATFPGLVLRSSLFWQWETRLHFSLGREMYQFKEDDTLNYDLFNTVYDQSVALFDALFAEEDEIVLVANVYGRKNSKAQTKPFKVFQNKLKNKKMALQIKLETLPYVFEDEEEAADFYTARYQLKCKKRDLRYRLLLQAICNEDFPLQPSFAKERGVYYPDVFFINLTKNAIFFVYDDRGCEMIAADKEVLRPLSDQYSEWLDEFEEM